MDSLTYPKGEQKHVGGVEVEQAVEAVQRVQAADDAFPANVEVAFGLVVRQRTVHHPRKALAHRGVGIVRLGKTATLVHTMAMAMAMAISECCGWHSHAEGRVLTIPVLPK